MSAILQLMALLATGHTVMTDTGACTQPLDISLVLDSSSSICPGGAPCPEWDALIDFVKYIVDSFTIGPNNVKVAVATISNEFKGEFSYNGYKDKAALLAAIGKLKFIGGEVESLLSAQLILNAALSLSSGDRLFVQNLMIVISDGMPLLSEASLTTMAFAFKAIGYKVIGVCVTERCPESLAKATSSEPKQANATYFLVDDYLLLYKIIGQLVKQICTK